MSLVARMSRSSSSVKRTGTSYTSAVLLRYACATTEVTALPKMGITAKRALNAFSKDTIVVRAPVPEKWWSSTCLIRCEFYSCQVDFNWSDVSQAPFLDIRCETAGTSFQFCRCQTSFQAEGVFFDYLYYLILLGLRVTKKHAIGDVR